MRIRYKFAALTFLLSTITSAGSASPFFDYVMDPFLVESIYQHPNRIHRSVEVAEDGAIGANIAWENHQSPKFYIEEQREAGDMIQAGIALHATPWIDKGIKALNWGIAHEAKDGSFPETQDAVHSVSFFVEALARSTMLLQESHLKQYDSTIQSWIDPLHRCATWFAKAAQDQELRPQNLYPYTHRYYLSAVALQQTALICHDEDLAKASLEYIEGALKMQWPDGTNPEKGGFDASYGSYGMALACRYYFLCDDEALRSQIKEKLVKGLERELSIMNSDGVMDISTSTRVGKEKDRTGVVKTMSFRSLDQALVGASLITGDKKYLESAKKVVAHW